MAKITIEKINLLPEDIKRAREKARLKPMLVFFAAVYIFICGFVYIYQKMEIRDKVKKAGSIKNEINAIVEQGSRYQQVMEQINITEKKGEEINKRLQSVGVIMKKQVKWSAVLKEITNIIPDNVWLTSLAVYDLSKEKKPKEGRGLKFTGAALSNKLLARFIASLENSLQFHNVHLQYSQKREVDSKSFYDFEITAEIKGAGI